MIPKPKKENNRRAYLNSVCDGLCKKIIRKRDKDTCQICNQKIWDSDYGVIAHFFGKKAYPYLRHNFQNLLYVHSVKCHDWLDGNIKESTQWFEKKFRHRHEYLLCQIKQCERFNTKYSILELEDVREYLKERAGE